MILLRALPTAFALALATTLAAPPGLAQPSKGNLIQQIPEHDIADPAAPEVTLDNLMESEVFWPYRVRLKRAAKPEGASREIDSDVLGVLIRVEPAGTARIDFGREGLVTVPVADTDLVERANRIRMGDDEKDASNFVLAIGARMLVSDDEVLRSIEFDEVAAQEGFLAVFADPSAFDFGTLAASLEPLRGRDQVLTVLFPQGRHTDEQVRSLLRKAEWPVPFVLAHLTGPYTESRLASSPERPVVQLQTKEGRVIYQAEWSQEVLPALTEAIDQAFPEGASPSVAGSSLATP